MAASAGPELERLIGLLARLPGLGPRSARRAALQLIKQKEALLVPLSSALAEVADKVRTCDICGNLDTEPQCALCRDPRREDKVICVVEQVGDLWALERASIFRGRYHVLGGVLSAMDGSGPEALGISRLVERARASGVEEVILALNATVEGQTTAHYIADRLEGADVIITGLAQGVPVGGELDYLDDGTLAAALSARRTV